MASPKLNGAGRFKQAEFVRHIFCATPEAGTTIEQLLKPEYWANISEQLKPGYRIEVMPEDGEFFAELVVRSCDRTSATTMPLRVVYLNALPVSVEQPSVDADPEFYVKFRGPHAKWCVMRKSDNTPVIDRIETQELALREMSDYVKSHKPRAA